MVDFSFQQLKNRLNANEKTTYWEVGRWIFAGGLFVGLWLTYAWLHTEILHIHYHKERFKKENNQLKEITTALRAEQSSLQNPEKINRQARQMGFISSHRKEVRIFQADILSREQARTLLAESLPLKKALRE